eukprot:TRINITY_DN4330_c0_g1_i1.p1 TRINITY_DN4330_c0_g1~~TRINITY_DN4330_c0_g1_i1.p1  ORF type:complete len:459 (-),score=89.25 TRINITY_DN4330_c0_g1_i1:574-1950(-)
MAPRPGQAKLEELNASADIFSFQNLLPILASPLAPFTPGQPVSHQLHNTIQTKLDALYQSGKISEADLDDRILDSLASFEPAKACQIVDSLANADLANIANKSAFLAGIMKRYRRQVATTAQPVNAATPPRQEVTQQFLDVPATAPAVSPELLSVAAKLSLLSPAQLTVLNQMLLANQIAVASQLVAASQIASGKFDPALLASVLPAIQQQVPLPQAQLQPQQSLPTLVSQDFLPTHAQSETSSEHGDGLSPIVSAKLEGLYESGVLHRGELDNRIIESLAQFPPAQALAILSKLSEADLSTVVNKNGFMAGIMRRFRSQLGQLAKGDRDAAITKSKQVQTTLLPRVQVALEILFSGGRCRREEIDAHVIAKLRDLEEATAVEVLHRFAEAKLETIVNKSGFLVGIIRRAQREKLNATEEAVAELTKDTPEQLDAAQGMNPLPLLLLQSALAYSNWNE